MTLYIPEWALWVVGLYLLGAVLNPALWVLTGEVSVRRLRREPGSLAIGMVAWPYSLACLPLVKRRDRRRERDRQRRISARVEAGEYDPEWARDVLGWERQ